MKRRYETHFDAAHFIPEHPKCGKIHGHTYRVIVVVDTDEFLDFHDLKEIVEDIIEPLDHNFISAAALPEKLRKQLYGYCKPLSKPLHTSEDICEYIKSQLPWSKVEVTVYEGESFSVSC
jgi:6-pyruvoyl tetrahydropterin synthase/QueD family protein